MKISLTDNLNPIEAIRKCGYGLVRDRNVQEQSFSRRLGQGFYPRFHVYINGREINLHLDQKQASYEGSHAHSGEYDGEVVEREGERIKAVIDSLVIAPPTVEPEQKDGFWKRIFGN